MFIPLREHSGRKSGDESEEISLRRDFAPDEARGEDTPIVRSGSFMFCFVKTGACIQEFLIIQNKDFWITKMAKLIGYLDKVF